MILVYLPPYSPDFNPIELAFSSFKAHISANDGLFRALMAGGRETQDALLFALIDAMYTVTPRKAHGWFRHCGYIH